MALSYLSEDLRAEKEVVMAAVQHSGLALQYASDALKADKDVVLAVVNNNADALQYTTYTTTSSDLRRDKQIWMSLLAQDGNHLAEAPEEYRRDKECVMAAVSSRHESLKYALAGLNQDQDCLVAAGLWDKDYNQDAPKIVLSTRFSLSENSSATATEFTLLLKEHSYFQEEAGFTIYSPNAFNKSTCDPEWTRMDWPCRGTYSSYQKQDSALKSGKPTAGSCWRYSFRYHLEKSKAQRGFMIQVVEIVAMIHLAGQGQRIESVMAAQVGIKVFKVLEPGFSMKGADRFNSRSRFRQEDIAELAHQIRRWYQQNCEDITECVVACPRIYDKGPPSFYRDG
jgi:hypothetical protein